MSEATFRCGDARERFSAYLDERLERAERSALRKHVAECRACAREAGSQDPAFLFAFGGDAGGKVSAEETSTILAGVRAGIALKAAERRIAPASSSRRSPARRALGTAAAVAAAAFVALTVGSSRPEVGSVAPTRPIDVRARGPLSATGALSAFAEARGPAAATSDAPDLSSLPIPSVPTMQKQLPADATIYDWNPGGGQPRVVWIVDRSLDI